MANGDGVDGAIGVVYLAQFRNVADGGVVEGKPAAVAQLHDGDGGKGLGDGSPVVGGVGIHRLASLAARLAKEELRCRLLLVNEGKPAAHDAVPGELSVKARVKRGDSGLGLTVGRGGEENGSNYKREGLRGIQAMKHGDNDKRDEPWTRNTHR